MNGVLSDAAAVLGVSVEVVFQKAAKAAGFSNWEQCGTFRYLQVLRGEESPPNYVIDFCLDCFRFDETSAVEGGQLIHAAAD